MNLFTIGFSKKNAKEFFDLLINNNIERLIDIRLNNKSQLAGFTKASDLQYFLKAIVNIEYLYMSIFAPTKELLNDYRKKKINWDQYKVEYLEILKNRNILKELDISIFNNACLLCSEAIPDKCHRKLLAEFLTKHYPDIKIIHL